jgi:hypothetical protein
LRYFQHHSRSDRNQGIHAHCSSLPTVHLVHFVSFILQQRTSPKGVLCVHGHDSLRHSSPGRVLRDAFCCTHKQCKHYTHRPRMAFMRRFSIARCSDTVPMSIDQPSRQTFCTLFELTFLTNFVRRNRENCAYHVLTRDGS